MTQVRHSADPEAADTHQSGITGQLAAPTRVQRTNWVHTLALAAANRQATGQEVDWAPINDTTSCTNTHSFELFWHMWHWPRPPAPDHTHTLHYARWNLAPAAVSRFHHSPLSLSTPVAREESRSKSRFSSGCWWSSIIEGQCKASSGNNLANGLRFFVYNMTWSGRKRREPFGRGPREIESCFRASIVLGWCLG